VTTLNRLALVLLLALVSACSTVYTGIVTLTQVVDAAAQDYASLVVQGQTTPEMDAKATAAHDQYRAACAVARDALKAYKAGGDQANYVKALEAARAAAAGFIDLIAPMLTGAESASLKSQLAKAVAL